MLSQGRAGCGRAGGQSISLRKFWQRNNFQLERFSGFPKLESFAGILDMSEPIAKTHNLLAFRRVFFSLVSTNYFGSLAHNVDFICNYIQDQSLNFFKLPHNSHDSLFCISPFSSAPLILSMLSNIHELIRPAYWHIPLARPVRVVRFLRVVDLYIHHKSL